jgi:hypothetical protein
VQERALRVSRRAVQGAISLCGRHTALIIDSRQQGHPQRQLIQRRPGRGERHTRRRAAPGAAASPSARIRGSTPARSSDDLPAPDAPDSTSSPVPTRRRDIRSSSATAAAKAAGPRPGAVTGSPYRGLAAFGEQDAAFFFGREAAAGACGTGSA